MRKILSLIFVFFACVAAAHANEALDSTVSAFDKERLANFDKTEAEALAEAARGGSPEDMEILTTSLSGKPLPFDDKFSPLGDWSCRVIKVGGTLPLTVYNKFKCRITEDEAGLFVEKISGSQRLTGKLYKKSDTELIFLGAGHVNDEPPRQYGQDKEQDQVAIVTRRADNKLVFEFPAPQFESKLDVLVMER
jgi:hypothetical protein